MFYFHMSITKKPSVDQQIHIWESLVDPFIFHNFATTNKNNYITLI